MKNRQRRFVVRNRGRELDRRGEGVERGPGQPGPRAIEPAADPEDHETRARLEGHGRQPHPRLGVSAKGGRGPDGPGDKRRLGIVAEGPGCATKASTGPRPDRAPAAYGTARSAGPATGPRSAAWPRARRRPSPPAERRRKSLRRSWAPALRRTLAVSGPRQKDSPAIISPGRLISLGRALQAPWIRTRSGG